jgi:hypothetical protein
MPTGLQRCLCTATCTKYLSVHQCRYHHQRLHEETHISKPAHHSGAEHSGYQSGTMIDDEIQFTGVGDGNELNPGAVAQHYATTLPGTHDIDPGYVESEAMVEFDHDELSSGNADLFLDDGTEHEPKCTESHMSLSETESLEIKPQIISNEDLRDYLEWLFGDTWTEQMLMIGECSFPPHGHIRSLLGVLLKSKTLLVKMT